MLVLLLTFLIVVAPVALGFGLAVALRPLHDERRRMLAQAKETREALRSSDAEDETEPPGDVQAESPVDKPVEPAEVTAAAPETVEPPVSEADVSPPPPEPDATPSATAPPPPEREPNALEKAIEEVGREILKEEKVETPVSKAPFDPNEILSDMISGDVAKTEAQPGEPGIDHVRNDTALPAGEEVDAEMVRQLMDRLGSAPAAPHVPHEVPDPVESENAETPSPGPPAESSPAATEPPDSPENPTPDETPGPSEKLEIAPDDSTSQAVPLLNEILGKDFDVDSLLEQADEAETVETEGHSNVVENEEPEGPEDNSEEKKDVATTAETVAVERPQTDDGDDEALWVGTPEPKFGVVEAENSGQEGRVAFVATEPETAAAYHVVREAHVESPVGMTDSRQIVQDPLPGGTTTTFSASMLRLRRKKRSRKES